MRQALSCVLPFFTVCVLASNAALGTTTEASEAPTVVLVPVTAVQSLQATNASVYLVNVTIGSDHQQISLAIDLWLQRTWVNPDCEHAPEPVRGICNSLPSYNAATSRTFVNTVNGTGGNATDSFTIGDATLPAYSFSIGPGEDGTGSNDIGVAGSLGLRLGQESMSARLAASGVIKNKAFGLSLGRHTRQGSLVLGGIDARKYKCTLQEFDYDTSASAPPFNVLSPYVPITGVYLTLPSGTFKAKFDTSFNLPDLSAQPLVFELQHDYRSSVVPSALLHAIGSRYPGAQIYPDAYIDVQNGTISTSFTSYSVPCSDFVPPQGYLTFSIGDTWNLTIPWSHFIVQQRPDLCILALLSLNDNTTPGTALADAANEDTQDVPPSSGPFFLGSAVLEHAYMVFDYDNDKLWMGEADDCGERVVAVGEGNEFIPRVKGCNCSDADAGGGNSGGGGTGSASPSATGTGQKVKSAVAAASAAASKVVLCSSGLVVATAMLLCVS